MRNARASSGHSYDLSEDYTLPVRLAGHRVNKSPKSGAAATAVREIELGDLTTEAREWVVETYGMDFEIYGALQRRGEGEVISGAILTPRLARSCLKVAPKLC